MNAIWQASVSEEPAFQIFMDTALPVASPNAIVEAGPHARRRVAGCYVLLGQRLDGSLALCTHPPLAAGTLEMLDA